MPRYIDADDLISVLDILCDKGGDIRYWEQLKWIVADCPTADVVERKNGKWLVEKVYEDKYGNEKFNCLCSECGSPAYEFFQPYCHRCGAKMSERRTDDAEIH